MMRAARSDIWPVWRGHSLRLGEPSRWKSSARTLIGQFILPRRRSLEDKLMSLSDKSINLDGSTLFRKTARIFLG